ncbi:MAG TPA: lasso peptide biosynthesis B2 protein [Candidatus Angelobacter sp.]|nr:lasso peptide biosynthesis B2 protein [Candidatus Angelobacter sp.]
MTVSLPNTELLAPSTSVRTIDTIDGAVLLDIRQGLCLSMTPISVKVWRLLTLNYTPDQIIDALCNEFKDVRREQIQEDVVEYLTDLQRKGLLLVREPVRRDLIVELLLSLFRCRSRLARHGVLPAHIAMPRCLMLKAVLALLAFDVFRFGENFPRIHSVVKAWPVARKVAPHDAMDRVCNAVNYACVLYPKRALCLQRSLVTTCLARSCGIAAQMVIGVQKIPLKAHAWTEINERPINERKDVRSIYLLWDRC